MNASLESSSKKLMTGTTLTQSRRMAVSNEPRSEGDIAANAFERFDRGVSPDEVVIELVLPVETVECLWRTWTRLRGVVSMSQETARALRELLASNRSLATGPELAIAVRTFVDRPLRRCTRCKGGCPEYCVECPIREANRAQKRTRARRKHSAAIPPPPSSEHDSLEADRLKRDAP